MSGAVIEMKKNAVWKFEKLQRTNIDSGQFQIQLCFHRNSSNGERDEYNLTMKTRWRATTPCRIIHQREKCNQVWLSVPRVPSVVQLVDSEIDWLASLSMCHFLAVIIDNFHFSLSLAFFRCFIQSQVGSATLVRSSQQVQRVDWCCFQPELLLVKLMYCNMNVDLIWSEVVWLLLAADIWALSWRS